MLVYVSHISAIVKFFPLTRIRRRRKTNVYTQILSRLVACRWWWPVSGRISQCFYFDKTLNKRLYIQFQITQGPGPDWNGRLRRNGYEGWIGMLGWNFFCVYWAWLWLLKGCRILQLREKWNTGCKKWLRLPTAHCAGWGWCSWSSDYLWFLSAELSAVAHRYILKVEQRI